MANEMTFIGLETLEMRIRKLNGDAAFLIIWDRTDPAHEEKLARFDLEPSYAQPYLMEAFDPALQETGSGATERDQTDDGPEEDDGCESEEPEDGERQESLEDVLKQKSGSRMSFADLLEAACRWVRDVAVRNTLGEEFRRFRVKQPPKE